MADPNLSIEEARTLAFGSVKYMDERARASTPSPGVPEPALRVEVPSHLGTGDDVDDCRVPPGPCVLTGKDADPILHAGHVLHRQTHPLSAFTPGKRSTHLVCLQNYPHAPGQPRAGERSPDSFKERVGPTGAAGAKRCASRIAETARAQLRLLQILKAQQLNSAITSE